MYLSLPVMYSNICLCHIFGDAPTWCRYLDGRTHTRNSGKNSKLRTIFEADMFVFSQANNVLLLRHRSVYVTSVTYDVRIIGSCYYSVFNPTALFFLRSLHRYVKLITGRKCIPPYGSFWRLGKNFRFNSVLGEDYNKTSLPEYNFGR
jgi:hypothetical protein